MIDIMVTTTTPAATVPVQSAFFSKINWAQAVQALAAVLVIATGGKINLSPTDQAYIVGAIVVVGNLATVILKTYFTTTVTPQSVSPTTSIISTKGTVQ